MSSNGQEWALVIVGAIILAVAVDQDPAIGGLLLLVVVMSMLVIAANKGRLPE